MRDVQTSRGGRLKCDHLMNEAVTRVSGQWQLEFVLMAMFVETVWTSSQELRGIWRQVF
jgi:hypothetical protein